VVATRGHVDLRDREQRGRQHSAEACEAGQVNGPRY
jgi:hypothetical protein